MDTIRCWQTFSCFAKIFFSASSERKVIKNFIHGHVKKCYMQHNKLYQQAGSISNNKIYISMPRKCKITFRMFLERLTDKKVRSLEDRIHTQLVVRRTGYHETFTAEIIVVVIPIIMYFDANSFLKTACFQTFSGNVCATQNYLPIYNQLCFWCTAASYQLNFILDQTSLV